MVQPIATHDVPVSRSDRRRPRVLGRGRICPDCDGTGSVWIICPDAGVAEVQCACVEADDDSTGSILVDLAVAGAFVSGCGMLFFAL